MTIIGAMPGKNPLVTTSHWVQREVWETAEGDLPWLASFANQNCLWKHKPQSIVLCSLLCWKVFKWQIWNWRDKGKSIEKADDSCVPLNLEQCSMHLLWIHYEFAKVVNPHLFVPQFYTSVTSVVGSLRFAGKDWLNLHKPRLCQNQWFHNWRNF